MLIANTHGLAGSGIIARLGRMDFEHIVQVNDPRLPALAAVDPQALWSALLLATHEPQRLRPDLDSVQVVATGAASWRRRLGFGALEVVEDVRADAARATITQHILAPAALAGGSRSVAIEAPAPGHLVLRFRYSSPHVDADPEFGDAHRAAFRSAYLQADVAQARALRELVAAQAR